MVLLALVVSCVAHQAQEPWRPAEGPLMTRWAKDVTPANAWPEYPRPQLVRKEWQNLNGLWEYTIRPIRDDQPPSSFDGRILVPFCVESALSGVMKPLLPDQRLWYRRRFTIPEDWRGLRVLLHFEASDWHTTVFVNGRSLGAHRGGYDPFTFDVTRALSHNGPQEIVVGVADPTDTGWQLRGKQTLHPGGAAYTACSGIWQTVWLEPVGKAWIERIVPATDPADGTVRLRIIARIPPRPVRVEAKVLEGISVASTATGVLGTELLPAVQKNLDWYKATLVWAETELTLRVPNPKPWTPDAPFLYGLEIALKDEAGDAIDVVTSYAGLRTIAIGRDAAGHPRVLLNGAALMIPGMLDQGYWPDGIYTAPTDEALRFDLEAAKKLGLVALRKHVKVEPDRWYTWADRLGILVFQDLPSGNQGDPTSDLPKSPEASTACESEMRLLIERRSGHPSIVAWVMFNEGWGQHDTLRYVKLARQLDPTRLVDEASGFPWHGGGDLSDKHGGLAEATPVQAGVNSETAGFGLATPGHDWPGKLWATETYDPATRGRTKGRIVKLHPLDDDSKEWYTREVAALYREMWATREKTGGSAVFKVQLTDVETEGNGVLSYDRAVWKVDPEEIARGCRR